MHLMMEKTGNNADKAVLGLSEWEFVMKATPAKLTLFHLAWCPYCLRVRRAALNLGISLDLVDISEDPAAHQALIAVRGRATVPVLRIEHGDEMVWMPESLAIVAYLHRRAESDSPDANLLPPPQGAL